MGFNLRSCHGQDLFEEDAGLYERVLRDRFGPSLRLGVPGSSMELPDEMGWSWWSELQGFAESRLGRDGSRYIRAVHAWHAVCVDADVERELLWPRGGQAESPDGPTVLTASVSRPQSFWGRLKSLFVKAPATQEIDAAVKRAMDEMVTKYAPRPEERNGLEVTSLRGVMSEAKALLESLSITPDDDAVRARWNVYLQDDARCDDDVHIQCLRHLWLTGNHALAHGQPMWLVK